LLPDPLPAADRSGRGIAVPSDWDWTPLASREPDDVMPVSSGFGKQYYPKYMYQRINQCLTAYVSRYYCRP
jgi:hypothetical protein